MHFLLNKAIRLLEKASNNLSLEQLQEFNALKEAISDYHSSTFDNYNYD